jgi:hypothetical protein
VVVVYAIEVIVVVVKHIAVNQSLVGSMVIVVELGREYHGSIPRNCDREGAGTT